ncbi:hypothetical protein C0989_004295 [Termitomyces sp. Mn162]|nr:hypothetical protein C0989_004295 [Termitomyces sp. Mn162]
MRHLRHNGERDTRGPADFSGESSGTRNDGPGDGDEEDDEGDAEEAVPSSPKKMSLGTKQSKDDEEFKPTARVIAEVGLLSLLHPRAVVDEFFQAALKHRGSVSNERFAAERSRSNLPMSAFPLFSYDNQHPMSSDRLNPAHERPYEDQPQNKKARLDHPLDMNMSREHGQSEDFMHRLHEPIYMYPPHTPFRRSSDASHPSNYPPYHLPYPSSPPPGHGPPSFHSPHSEFALSQHISSWVRTHGPGSANGAGPGGLPAFFAEAAGGHLGHPSFDGLPFTRNDEGRPGGSNEKNGRDTFANTFLEADQQQRKVSLPPGGMPISRGSTSAASFGIDWPSHRSSSLPHPGAPPTPPAVQAPVKPDAAPDESVGASSTPDSSGAGWLELLSGAAPAANTHPASDTPIPRTRSSSAASASGTGAAGT